MPPAPNKRKLNVYQFGQRLVTSQDLDPVYVVLWDAGLSEVEMRRWLLAYWCFYHVGTASWIVDESLKGGEESYWMAMAQAAASKEYPRSKERRHFRGKSSIDSVAWLSERGIDSLFEPMFACDEDPVPLKYVMTYIQTWKCFGPWISFKAADMLERLNIVNVEFTDTAMFMFDSPNKGAQDVWNHYGEGDPPNDVGMWALNSLSRRLAAPENKVSDFSGRIRLSAPPRFERVVGAQEFETILCKWHSYLGGHYRLGEDLEAVHQGLLWRTGETATKLINQGRKAGII